MTARLALLFALAVVAGGCDLLDASTGTFQATVTGDFPADLVGSAVYDADDDGGTIALLPSGINQGSQLLIAVRARALEEGTLALGLTTDDAAITYQLRGDRGGLALTAVAGTLALTEVADDRVVGRFDITAAGDGSEVQIEGAFEAVAAFNP